MVVHTAVQIASFFALILKELATNKNRQKMLKG